MYEADSLLDVVSCTRIAAQLLRGARAVRSAGGKHAFAWGRLPLSGDVVSVEFSRGRVRKSGPNAPVVGAPAARAAAAQSAAAGTTAARATAAGATVLQATVLQPTGWCWVAAADGHYDVVIVRCGGTAIRSRLRVSRP